MRWPVEGWRQCGGFACLALLDSGHDELAEQMRPSCGVLYIAAGKAYASAANAAARSVKALLPNLPVDIFTDSPDVLEPGLFDQVAVIDSPHRRSKVDYLPRTRFERTLYLDTDTRVVEDISDLFELLERFDIAMAHAHARNRRTHVEQWRITLPQSFPQLNGGVILYRSDERVLEFLHSWSAAYHDAGFSKDQTTLRELIWDSDLRLYVLPPEYNVRYEKYVKIWEQNEATPKILHYRRFHDQVGAAESDSLLSGAGRLLRRLKGGLATVKATAGQAQSAKVFGVGFHKTGTSSLAQALKILGYRTIHGDSSASWHGGNEGRGLIEMIDSGNFQLPTLERFDAFCDNPYFTIWQQLAASFPDARFVLTIRDEQQWLDSCVRYYKGRRIRPMRSWLFGEHADPSSSSAARAAWLNAYRAHNAAVLDYFHGKPNFLVMDIFSGDGWAQLCGFLQQAVPQRGFPHANKTQSST